MVRCYGARSDESGDRQFIFLEYCAGGELFDKIGEREGKRRVASTMDPCP